MKENTNIIKNKQGKQIQMEKNNDLFLYEGFGIFQFVLDIILNETIYIKNFDGDKWEQIFASFLYFVISGFSFNKEQRMKEKVLTIKKIYKKYGLKKKIHSTSHIHDILQGKLDDSKIRRNLFDLWTHILKLFEDKE